MNEEGHRRLMATWANVISEREWARLGEVFTPGAVMEYPQSGERFSGLDNIRGQFEDYPGFERDATELNDVVGGTTYAITPLFTVIGVDGSGDRGTVIFRVRYPDGAHWWAVSLYELEGDRIDKIRGFWAPEFAPPDWRAPYRDKG